MTGEHSETVLSETDVLELDILSLLQSAEAVRAFEAYSALITPRTAGRFAELLRMINRLSSGGVDFSAAVETEMFAAVRSPVDITRLERFGALASTDPMLKLAAVQMLRTIHDTESAEPSTGSEPPAEGPRDVR
ncbi:MULTISPECIES: hypothetical protein [Nocardiaceae]|uniref:hypothetical protein n=1 Tax=Nocardiaceae TaxID=85025 RepID=UPI00050CD13B|nr:hypothetical protein [Rhodococcus fascians]